MNKRKTGADYEKAAAEYLLSKGYVILERNFRSRRGEIDLIAMDTERHTLCFVEVKYRSGSRYGRPAASVTQRKQQTIIETSRYYVYLRRMTDFPQRFDVIEFIGGEPVHIENAFMS